MTENESSATSHPVEIKKVASKKLSCDGGGGPLGHPRVFLEMGDDTEVDCPYCGCRFVFEAQTAAAPSGS